MADRASTTSGWWLGPRQVRALAAVVGLTGVVLPVVVVKWVTASTRLPAVDEGGPLRPEMVVVPAGAYTVGSLESDTERYPWEFDQHTVTLSREFAIGTTEVTQEQYQRVTGENPPTDSACPSPTCPVINVSWLDAAKYAVALSQRDVTVTRPCYEIEGEEVKWIEIEKCDGYRLPTEAEWEVAARAGSVMRYAGTDDPSKICDYGNVADVSSKLAENPERETFACDDGFAGLAPVARFRPNAFGLYDMTGNVWEWTWDWNGEDPGSSTNPMGPSSGQDRVIRGGSFGDIPRIARVAYRSWLEPSERSSDLGFRVARSLP